MYKYTGMWQSMLLVAREEGRRGLYAGMGTHVARVVRIYVCLVFFFVQQCVFLTTVKESRDTDVSS